MVENEVILEDIGQILGLLGSPLTLLVVVGVFFLDYLLEAKGSVILLSMPIMGIIDGLTSGDWSILIFLGGMVGFLLSIYCIVTLIQWVYYKIKDK